ncbi:MerR family transcriptional regulator [Desulfosporosinus sp.]|uniref:MerR family transcriptional regulator n=1 Tax=Desulfosporosinus sp. TaxID=157907 RepID=UPI0025BEF02B|nr:MerR family transcriptional regulator [Desulfosporosinus sp.]MBC2724544.1 MerR family transcriptional regulator [Desulfosporosinus sp.]MBC2726730.1 MerR family transcriptional regulator [Desulfosporosinus sp.]
MFKIGDFSKLTLVSVRMLRYYDELGLLKPAQVDSFTGYRYYSAKQISSLNKIVKLRDMGFLIAEIAEILEASNNHQRLLLKLEEKQKQIQQNISHENEKLNKLEQMIVSIGMESVSMNYEVTIKTIPSCKVVSLREIIPQYDMEGQLWMKLGGFMEEQKLLCIPPGFAIYHDMEYKESDVDVEVAIGVENILEDQGVFKFRETEAVPNMASMMVPGPFENIAPAYNALAEWVEKNEYKIDGAARQICHKGPWNENSSENYLTEVMFPVHKR